MHGEEYTFSKMATEFGTVFIPCSFYSGGLGFREVGEK